MTGKDESSSNGPETAEGPKEQDMNQETEAGEGKQDAEAAAPAESAAEASGQQEVKGGKAPRPSTQDRIDQLTEDLKRAQAETINQARRMEAEIKREYVRGVENALNGMPEIVDDLERALDAKTDDYQSIRDGVAITLDQFKKLLAGHGIETIEPEPGDRIDPQLHQAISREESSRYEENRVLRAVLKGYRHGQRVLRPASVVACAAPAKAAEKAPEKDKEEGEGK